LSQSNVLEHGRVSLAPIRAAVHGRGFAKSRRTSAAGVGVGIGIGTGVRVGKLAGALTGH